MPDCLLLWLMRQWHGTCSAPCAAPSPLWSAAVSMIVTALHTATCAVTINHGIVKPKARIRVHVLLLMHPWRRCGHTAKQQLPFLPSESTLSLNWFTEKAEWTITSTGTQNKLVRTNMANRPANTRLRSMPPSSNILVYV